MYGSCCNDWCFPAMTSAFFSKSSQTTSKLHFQFSSVQKAPYWEWLNSLHSDVWLTESWSATNNWGVIHHHLCFCFNKSSLHESGLSYRLHHIFYWWAVLPWYLSIYITNTAVAIPPTNHTGPTQIKAFCCKSYCTTAMFSALVNNICRLLEVLFEVLIFIIIAQSRLTLLAELLRSFLRPTSKKHA